METEKDKLISYLKTKVNEKRFIHSINTAKVAVMLAKRYGADEEKAYVAGLLHDIAKGQSADSLIKLSIEYGVPVDKYELDNPELMHGKIGAAIIKKELGICDEEILSAIEWHTTGHGNMSLLEKIVYLADIIEPGRKFTETDSIRQIAYEDIDAAMMLCLKHVMSFVKNKGFSLHPKSIEAYNYLNNQEVKKGV